MGGGVGCSAGRFFTQRLVGWLSGRSHETHGRRDLGFRGRRTVATDEPGFVCLRLCLDRAAVARRKCTVLHADTCAVLTMRRRRRRRAWRAKMAKMAKTGSRRRVTVHWRCSPFAPPVCRGRATQRSPLHSPSRHSHRGGRHSLAERGCGRLSQGSLVDENGTRSARAPLRGWAICSLELKRRREWIRCPSDEFMTFGSFFGLARSTGGPMWTSRRIGQTRSKRGGDKVPPETGRWPTERLQKRDFEAFVIQKAERADGSGQRGFEGPLFYREGVGSAQASGIQEGDPQGRRSPRTKQEQRWWLDDFASQQGGTTATVDSPRPPEEGAAASTNCQPPSYDEIADVVAVLPKLRATAPHGVPNEAFQPAPLVMVTQLESPMQKVFLGGPHPQRVAHQVG